jgi:hypothetical protein
MADDARPTHDGESGTPAEPDSKIRPAPEPGLTDYLDPFSPNHAFGRGMNAPGRWIDEQVENAGERIADMTGWRPTPPTYQPSQPRPADGGIHVDDPGGSADVGGPGGSIDFGAGFPLGSQSGDLPATSVRSWTTAPAWFPPAPPTSAQRWTPALSSTGRSTRTRPRTRRPSRRIRPTTRRPSRRVRRRNPTAHHPR